ncbi:MAG: PAS domain-containing protein [Gammaproteobacteria bacterium]|nr:PAS domain-containing protein [Gammaproteobacteria bacterium]
MDGSRNERQRIAYETLVSPEFDIGVFAGIARVVAQGLGFRGAGIVRLTENATQMETLGLWVDGEVGPNFKAALAGTPCEVTLAHQDTVTLIDSNLHRRFTLAGPFTSVTLQSYYGVALRDAEGAPIGMLYAIDDQPHSRHPSEESLLKVAAARAVVELRREVVAEQIRESEERMRFALEAGALGMWEWDLAADSWVYNDRWAEMRGYAQGEVVPHFFDGLPEDVERVRPLVERLLAGDIDSYEIEFRTPHKDGSWRWINSRTKIMKRGADGRPVRIVGVQTDIHERRLAEERERANQQWLTLTLDATELGMWDWDATTDKLVWSERCASILGYRLDEMPDDAAGWMSMQHPEDHAEGWQKFKAHLKGEVQQLRLELRCRAKDGRWVWLLVNGRVTERDANGRALRAVGTHQDISQLKNAEFALRESEARLRTVVENSPVGIFLVASDGAVVYCNPVILALRGAANPAAGSEDFEWMHLVHPDDRDLVAQRWQAFLARPDGIYDLEWRACLPSGRVLNIRVRAAPIREGQRVLGFAGTMEDVSEQRAAERRERALEAQLQQTQKLEAIGRLTGGVAHDFNNSLATILGFASLALGRPGEDAKLGNYLETIVQAAEHSRDLVRKLLDFSRSTPAGEVEALDVVPRIIDAARMLQAVIPATVRVVTCFDPQLPAVRIDATDLNQLLFNLVLNARDAIDEHGEHGQIGISLRAPRALSGACSACHRALDGEYVELAVSDTGGGISGDSLPRIFDPFFSTKAVGKGTGMGLSVLHGIVHRADGHILVESTLGRGTVMRVLLRAGAVSATATDNIQPVINIPTTSSQQSRVLVVDDEPSIVQFLREWLEVEGFAVEAFTDPLAARNWAQSASASFDALITDQTMPGMTGMELARDLRELRPSLPVIVCTGLADRVSAAQASALGVTHLFTKPMPMPDLLASLRRALAVQNALT